MKSNIFKLFLNKFLAYPLWVKQVVYYRLWQNMKENNCEKYIIDNADKIFSLHIPTLTFKGKQELWDKKGGLDNNIYNFLKYAHNGYTIIETALNMFMSVEEIAKLFIFAIEQNLIEKPEDSETYAMAGFISGKLFTGEYFVENKTITEEQLNLALMEQTKNDCISNHMLIGKVLTDKGFVEEGTVRTLFKLKSDSRKRFVINPDMLPDSNRDIKPVNELENEIKALRAENSALKKTMAEIIKAVKHHDI